MIIWVKVNNSFKKHLDKLAMEELTMGEQSLRVLEKTFLADENALLFSIEET